MPYLEHFGIKGQRWGLRRFQNPDGTWTEAGKKRYEDPSSGRKQKKQEVLFVSGSSKTQDKSTGYYRKKLPDQVKNELKRSMHKKDKIVVGDAPGIDRQVQDYLNGYRDLGLVKARIGRKYKNVEVYSPGTENRYLANKNWKVNYVDDKKHEPGSKEWLAKKDEAMTEVATKGLAVILSQGSTATKNNVQRLLDQNKNVKTFLLYDKKAGKYTDEFINPKLIPTLDRVNRAKNWMNTKGKEKIDTAKEVATIARDIRQQYKNGKGSSSSDDDHPIGIIGSAQKAIFDQFGDWQTKIFDKLFENH